MGNDGRSRGCGIVELATVEEAMSAIGGLHDTELMGRKIFVREDREDGGGGSGNNNNINRNNNMNNNMNNRNAAVSRGGYGSGGGYGGGGGNAVPVGRSVYVGNLSYETAWQDLKDHMRSAGDVLHAEVMSMSDGRSKGCGIVEYATTESAARAIAELNDSELMGRQIFVREDREGGGNNRAGGGRGGGVGGVSGAREGDGGYLAGPYHAAGFGGGGGRGNVGNNLSVYVGNLPYETTWQELKDHMRAAGNVDKVTLHIYLTCLQIFIIYTHLTQSYSYNGHATQPVNICLI
jgi:RNA recognition motif-containing protein